MLYDMMNLLVFWSVHQTLSAGDLRVTETSDLIAAKLREFHKLDMPGPKNVLLWERLRTWLKEAKNLCSPTEIDEFRLEAMDGEINLLKERLTREDQEIGFCHNDLQYGNVMIDEETNAITIIVSLFFFFEQKLFPIHQGSPLFFINFI